MAEQPISRHPHKAQVVRLLKTNRPGTLGLDKKPYETSAQQRTRKSAMAWQAVSQVNPLNTSDGLGTTCASTTAISGPARTARP